MPMQIEYRDTPWQIEGETVRWGEFQPGRECWVCTCWDHTPPDRGEPPSCFHTRAVSDAAFLKIDIEESGPKVVSLRRARETS